jgi:hypothetical protein
VLSRLAPFLSCAALLAVAGAAGCDGDSAGLDLDAPLAIDDVAGAWTVDVPGTTACIPALGPFTIGMELQHSHLADYLGVEGEEYFSGQWWVDDGAGPFFVQGWAQLEAQTFRLLLWQGTHVKGSVLMGRIYGGGEMRATLLEPIPPGDGWAADPIPGYPGGFAQGSCEWKVEGRHADS